MLRGKFPRSPVWLRKIPSTVSGSQGSRRGLRPAVRFACPLGARVNITLRARPGQELFSESFRRPSRGPRGATPPGLRPFAATSSALYAPPPRRGRETIPHTGCRQLRRGKAEGDVGDAGREGSLWPGVTPRPAVPALRPGPYTEPPRRLGACAPRPSGAAGLTASIRPPIHGALAGGTRSHLQAEATLPAERRRLRCARPTGARGRPVPAFGDTPEKRRTAASGARPPSARAAPRRPSLVDSLCAESFPLISI